MRKKLKNLWQRLESALVPPPEPPARQEHAEAIKRTLLSRIFDNGDREVTTIPVIASTLACSHEFVRVRVINSPGVFRVGNKYRIPRSVVEGFIEQLYRAA